MYREVHEEKLEHAFYYCNKYTRKTENTLILAYSQHETNPSHPECLKWRNKHCCFSLQGFTCEADGSGRAKRAITLLKREKGK